MHAAFIRNKIINFFHSLIRKIYETFLLSDSWNKESFHWINNSLFFVFFFFAFQQRKFWTHFSVFGKGKNKGEKKCKKKLGWKLPAMKKGLIRRNDQNLLKIEKYKSNRFCSSQVKNVFNFSTFALAKQ